MTLYSRYDMQWMDAQGTPYYENILAWVTPEAEEIRTLLLGVIEARGRVLLSMNVAADRLPAVIAELPAMKRPTVNQLYGSEDYEVMTVADKATVNILIPRLKAAGAEDILEMPISKIVR